MLHDPEAWCLNFNDKKFQKSKYMYQYMPGNKSYLIFKRCRLWSNFSLCVNFRCGIGYHLICQVWKKEQCNCNPVFLSPFSSYEEFQWKKGVNKIQSIYKTLYQTLSNSSSRDKNTCTLKNIHCWDRHSHCSILAWELHYDSTDLLR